MIWGSAPVLAGDAVYQFRWDGAGGYAVRGALAYPSALDGQELILDRDLSCFVIEGLKDGTPIGRWGLGDLDETTSWRLHFDPVRAAFLVEGDGVWMPQAWNMNGEGEDCGEGGFGFNIGNAAQDICLDGGLIVESQVDPYRPFPAERVARYRFPGDACLGPDLLSHWAR